MNAAGETLMREVVESTERAREELYEMGLNAIIVASGSMPDAKVAALGQKFIAALVLAEWALKLQQREVGSVEFDKQYQSVLSVYEKTAAAYAEFL